MWKIDSRNITDYNASNNKLEALLIFWVLAAGKSAKGAERILSEILPNEKKSPFKQLYNFSKTKLPLKLKSHGCGCYNMKGRTLFEIIHANLNLKTCSVDDLEEIFGIGKKTSRAFVLHTRKDSQYGVLDTHLLKFLTTKGVKNVPKSTPASTKEYLRLEQEFLKICKEENVSPAFFDFKTWGEYAI